LIINPNEKKRLLVMVTKEDGVQDPGADPGAKKLRADSPKPEA
jgi:hypothetical protein